MGLGLGEVSASLLQELYSSVLISNVIFLFYLDLCVSSSLASISVLLALCCTSSVSLPSSHSGSSGSSHWSPCRIKRMGHIWR